MRLTQQITIMILALFSLICQAAVTEVTATIDKNPVMVDESVLFEIVANDKMNIKVTVFG